MTQPAYCVDPSQVRQVFALNTNHANLGLPEEVRMPLAPATGTGDPDALGGYLVSGRLGEGNQGVVYAADTPDGDAVAIKLLHPRFRLADERAERFLAALEPLVEAEHPHVPTLLDAGIHDGRPYVVHQRAHGFPLLANVSGTG